MATVELMDLGASVVYLHTFTRHLITTMSLADLAQDIWEVASGAEVKHRV